MPPSRLYRLRSGGEDGLHLLCRAETELRDAAISTVSPVAGCVGPRCARSVVDFRSRSAGLVGLWRSLLRRGKHFRPSVGRIKWLVMLHSMPRQRRARRTAPWCVRDDRNSARLAALGVILALKSRSKRRGSRTTTRAKSQASPLPYRRDAPPDGHPATFANDRLMILRPPVLDRDSLCQSGPLPLYIAR